MSTFLFIKICRTRNTRKAGCRGGSPCKKKRCHPEAASADRLPPKDLVLTELFLGQRGAYTEKSAVNNRINIDKALC